jgi:tRNA (guanine-N(7)-)-methyltransferase subunit TRM82
MPKRICAITLTRDEKTIVAGDKFGDVYSLPLFPSEDVPQKTSGISQQDSLTDFKPSASELTVHTKGNLEALRQQQQQKKLKSKKEGLAFQHRLLLGHVSLLTDLAIAEVDSEAGGRQYILTADRDEHIRVSRGISQAHVIENYCLGHREFVSKLCILPWQTTTLIAGSGEPSLKVYDWQRGLCTTDLLVIDGSLGKVKEYIKTEGWDRSTDNLAVSGIWPVLLAESRGCLLVALEGLPLLLSYVHNGKTFARAQIIQLAGNVLDVAVAGAGRLILVSVDTIHQPCSMKARRVELLNREEAIICFALQDTTQLGTTHESAFVQEEHEVLPIWTRSTLPVIAKALVCEPVIASVSLEEEKKHRTHNYYSKLGEFLYGLENLRKQRGQEEIEAEEEPETGANGPAEDEDL